MDYVEVRLTVPPESLEAVACVLHEHGTGGVVVDDEALAALRAYLPLDDRFEPRWDRLRSVLGDLLKPYFPALAEWHVEQSITQSLVHEEDWANAWRAYFRPTRVGKRLVVAPSWSDYQPTARDLVLRLDPGMAFGTGTHPTTVLCLRALERLVHSGDHILDVGTGSGILAVAAAALGAGRVTAIDIDPIAVRIAGENAAYNNVDDRIEVLEAALPRLLTRDPKPVQLAVANLTADLLCELALSLKAALRPGGVLVGSGIVAAYQEQVETAWKAAGLSPWRTASMDGWVAIWMRRPLAAEESERRGERDGR